MKLGPLRRFHYAHAVERSACAAAGGEGALHLDAKLRLAAALADLAIRAETSGEDVAARVDRLCHRAVTDPYPCRATETVPWISGWDEVRVEVGVPGIRPDILLLGGGSPIAAIEVRATHAVDEEKAIRLAELPIQWIEVPASAFAPTNRGGRRARWTPGDPIPVLRDSAIEPERWRCAIHRRLHEAWLDSQRNGVHRRAWRMVHLHRQDGGLTAGEARTDRIEVAVYERRVDGRVTEAWIVREDSGSRIGRSVQGENPSIRELHQEFRAWCSWTRQQRRAHVDSPMRWLPAEEVPTRRQDELFPARVRWDLVQGRYVQPPNLPSLAWPVLGPPGAANPAPHPVFGVAPCSWSDLPGVAPWTPLVHAVAPPVWISLRQHGWEQEGNAYSRGEVWVYAHDGRGWEPLRLGAYAVDLVLDPGESIDWSMLAQPIAEALAEPITVLGRSARVAELIREVAARFSGGGARRG